MGKGSRNRRMQQDAAGATPEVKKSVSSLWVRIGTIALIVAMVAVLVFGILYSTGTLQRTLSAVKVGNEKTSGTEFNIYYTDMRNNFLNNYGSTLQQYGYDLLNIDLQSCLLDPEITWRQYFVGEATKQITEANVLYQEAQANGFEMTDEIQEKVDNFMAGYYTQAEKNNVEIEEYIKSLYGDTTRLKDVENVYTKRFYSNAYYTTLYEANQFTDDQIEEHYQANKDLYDVVDFYAFAFPYETYTYIAPAEGEEVEEGMPTSAEEATRMSEESKTAAQEMAEEMQGRITDGDSFEKLAREYYDKLSEDGDEEFTSPLYTAQPIKDASGDLGEWYADSARQEGDITMMDSNGQFVVTYFVSRYRSEAETATVRHILISTVATDENSTQEELNSAEVTNTIADNKSADVLKQWQEGDRTEDSFIMLAKEYSEDTGTIANGGLIENFAQGSMVPEFDAWCFDKARQPGDVERILTEYGYHIIYYIGHGEHPQYYTECLKALQDEAYTAQYKELAEKYAVKTNNFSINLAS